MGAGPGCLCVAVPGRHGKTQPQRAEILKRCDGSRPLSEIVAQLESAFGATGLGPDVDAFMAEARQHGWVV